MNFSNIEGRYIDTLIEDYVELANGDICSQQFFLDNYEFLQENELVAEKIWADFDLTSFDIEE